MAVWFLGTQADPAVAADMAAIWRATGGELPLVAGAMMAHPAAWEGPGRVRPPVEWVAAALRVLEVPPEAIAAASPGEVRRLVEAPLRAMGQPWMRAPGPDGWPEEDAAWITAPAMAARLTWAMTAPEALGVRLPDPAGAVGGGDGGAGLLVAALRRLGRREPGRGRRPDPERAAVPEAPLTMTDVTRRTVLAGACSAAASPLVTPVALASVPGEGRLVVIVLRGAMDGLDVVRPEFEPAIGALRPAEPGRVPLGDWSLHPRARAGGAAPLGGARGLHPLSRRALAFRRAGPAGGRDRARRRGAGRLARAARGRDPGRRAGDGLRRGRGGAP